jgi:hypothetical protein
VTDSPESELSVKSGAGRPSSTDKRSSVHRALGPSAALAPEIADGDRFGSRREQTERIRSVAEGDGLKLVDTMEELDVSEGTPLVTRHGLRRGVELVEAVP